MTNDHGKHAELSECEPITSTHIAPDGRREEFHFEASLKWAVGAFGDPFQRAVPCWHPTSEDATRLAAWERTGKVRNTSRNPLIVG